MGEGRVHPLNEFPALAEPNVSFKDFVTLLNGNRWCSEAILAPPLTTRTPSMFCLHWGKKLIPQVRFQNKHNEITMKVSVI